MIVLRSWFRSALNVCTRSELHERDEGVAKVSIVMCVLGLTGMKSIAEISVVEYIYED